jgi:hypothetical protein
MYFLLEKQRNRGQDGAGLACLRIDAEPGEAYVDVCKSNAKNAIEDLFEQIRERSNNATDAAHTAKTKEWEAHLNSRFNVKKENGGGAAGNNAASPNNGNGSEAVNSSNNNNATMGVSSGVNITRALSSNSLVDDSATYIRNANISNKATTAPPRKNFSRAENPADSFVPDSFCGDCYLGHVRYGTFGGNSLSELHPFIRESNWRSKCMILAGNYNLTNCSDLFEQLVESGQHPRGKSDTITCLEIIGQCLDSENMKQVVNFASQGHVARKCQELAEENINLADVLSTSASGWDGGYEPGFHLYGKLD